VTGYPNRGSTPPVHLPAPFENEFAAGATAQGTPHGAATDEEETMNKQHLQGMLQDLHTELGRAEVLNEDEKALLRHVNEDVETLLARSGETPQHEESLGQRLQESIALFETTHPSLTVAMQRVLDGLSGAGI
jgi:hypothetical protein